MRALFRGKLRCFRMLRETFTIASFYAQICHIILRCVFRKIKRQAFDFIAEMRYNITMYNRAW